MDFPITELMDREACIQWLEEYFHPDGLKCPHCQASIDQAVWYRKTKKSDLAGCRRGKKPPELLAWIAKSRLKQGKKSLEIARFGNLVKPKGDFSGFSDSLLDVYRCKNCRGIYNLYSGTVFAGRHFTPEQTILFLREVLQGKSSAKLARELRISRTTALEVRHLLQANAESEQTTEPLSDLEAMH